MQVSGDCPSMHKCNITEQDVIEHHRTGCVVVLADEKKYWFIIIRA